jgi:hypothetical protein
MGDRPAAGQDVWVLILRATKKLLQRVGRPTLRAEDESTTQLGQWNATALFWKPQVALLVNESTLLPVLMPLAPAGTLPARAGEAIAAVLAAHGAPEAFTAAEQQQMTSWRIGPTANRSVVGIMNEFTFLADTFRDGNPSPSLLDVALRLAATPCGPLYKTNVSPDRELAARILESQTSLAGDDHTRVPGYRHE